MAPSETSILSNFLLSAASLPTVMSLQQFTELFPKRLRAHPHIRVLYRELQQLREQDMDIVNENIDKEVRRGESQKAELRKSLAETGVDGADMKDQHEMDMDVQLFGPTSASSNDYHSVSSLLSAMESACAGIEGEMAGVDDEAATLLSELSSIVGGMSDLRYGKMHGSIGATDEEVAKTMPSIPLHPRAPTPRENTHSPLPTLLQTPSGLALLELQGTINLPEQTKSQGPTETGDLNPSQAATATTYETPVGKLLFPDYSAQNGKDDTVWMKRVYLYVGRYQRMTGEVKKLPKPLAIIQRRQDEDGARKEETEELEIVEVVKYKLVFKNRPEPVNDA
ncbi:hypothetical protein BDV06DRAFT_212837 [Aspergillus oleicola]